MPRLNLLVLYCTHLSECVHFYRQLGLEFVAEQHGDGPAHFSADMNGLLLELYPAPPDYTEPSPSPRLGLELGDLEAVWAHVSKYPGRPCARPRLGHGVYGR